MEDVLIPSSDTRYETADHSNDSALSEAACDVSLLEPYIYQNDQIGLEE